jgi:hypothetical protein
MIQITEEDAREIVFRFGIDLSTDPDYYQLTSQTDCQCKHCLNGRHVPDHSTCECNECKGQRVMSAFELRGLGRVLELLCPGITKKPGTIVRPFPGSGGGEA